MYGKSLYNKTLYSRTNEEGSGTLLYCRIRSSYGVEAPNRLKALYHFVSCELTNVYNFLAEALKKRVGLTLVTTGMRCGVSTDRIGWFMPMSTRTGMVYDFAATSLHVDDSEEFTLENLNLRPGQEIVIDTDALEVWVDGVNNLDAWVTGGTFFQLKNGTNEIRVYDNANSRNLRVTVVWADRYL